jgi:hypothetical protein
MKVTRAADVYTDVYIPAVRIHARRIIHSTLFNSVCVLMLVFVALGLGFLFGISTTKQCEPLVITPEVKQ